MITVSPLPQINISTTNVSSPGACDGTASVSGISGYTYQWLNSNGNTISTSTIVYQLCAGNYSLYVIDANGCANSSVFTIYSSCTFGGYFLSTNPSTTTSCDGNALFIDLSSYSIISYQWTNSQGTLVSNTNYAINLCNDAYILTAIDSEGSNNNSRSSFFILSFKNYYLL